MAEEEGENQRQPQQASSLRPGSRSSSLRASQTPGPPGPPASPSTQRWWWSILSPPPLRPPPAGWSKQPLPHPHPHSGGSPPAASSTACPSWTLTWTSQTVGIPAPPVSPYRTSSHTGMLFNLTIPSVLSLQICLC